MSESEVEMVAPDLPPARDEDSELGPKGTTYALQHEPLCCWQASVTRRLATLCIALLSCISVIVIIASASSGDAWQRTIGPFGAWFTVLPVASVIGLLSILPCTHCADSIGNRWPSCLKCLGRDTCFGGLGRSVLGIFRLGEDYCRLRWYAALTMFAFTGLVSLGVIGLLVFVGTHFSEWTATSWNFTFVLNH